MALANYADLQASVIAWMTRTGDAEFAAKVPDMIALAEARLNRELGVVETDAALSGTVGSRRIDLAATPFVAPIALFLVDANGDERRLQQQGDGACPYAGEAGAPDIWAVDGAAIDFDRPLDAAYAFRLRYRQKFNLAAASTNWLLTNHPDLYLAASLIWGAGFTEAFPQFGFWKAVLDEGIPSVRNLISQRNRGTLRVDPGLMGARRFDPVTP